MVADNQIAKQDKALELIKVIEENRQQGSHALDVANIRSINMETGQNMMHLGVHLLPLFVALAFRESSVEVTDNDFLHFLGDSLAQESGLEQSIPLVGDSEFVADFISP